MRSGRLRASGRKTTGSKSRKLRVVALEQARTFSTAQPYFSHRSRDNRRFFHLGHAAKLPRQITRTVLEQQHRPEKLPVDATSDFSLVAGGPLYRLARRWGLPDGSAGFVRLGQTLALLTWLPLLALAPLGRDDTAISFLHSLGTHARLLVAIPLFFVAEAAFDTRSRQLIRTIVASRVGTRRPASGTQCRAPKGSQVAGHLGSRGRRCRHRVVVHRRRTAARLPLGSLHVAHHR